MKVEIWSDVVCPFCYIGKRKFEMGLAQFKHKNEVKVIWHSFQLDPDAAYVPGKTIHEMLAEKKGWTTEQSEQIHVQMTQSAADVGLEYNFDKVIPVNTYNAHRLIHFAAKYGMQDKAKERLLHAYFTDGLNVSDVDTLIKLGVEIGLDADKVKAMLTSNEMGAEVKADIDEANSFGIRGVPFFVLNRKYAISGAQSPETFLSALEKAWAEWKQENPLVDISVADGDTCTPGEPC